MVKGVTTAAAQSNSDSEMETRVMRFVRQKLNTFVRWDIARFFHNNPHAADTADAIARALGRESAEITPELQALAANGVLEGKTSAGMTIFSLTEDAALRALVHDFVIACDNRDFRAAAIKQVIDGLR